MNIKSMLLTVNKFSRPGTMLKLVKGVVIHYVGNPNTSAEANRNYFESLKAGKKDSNGNYIYASSQYIIGLSGEIILCVPENEVAYCSNNRNNDTISIECCHPLADGKFADATYKSLIALVADICKRYGLNPLQDVIRHHDVTGKACPLFHVNNPGAWESLKKDVQAAMNGQKLPEKGYINLNLDGASMEIRADNIDGTYEVKLDELARVLGDVKIPIRYVLERIGKAIEWDGHSKTIKAYDSAETILHKITQAEAGGEDRKGRILVANVIMNRVKSSIFPDTIRDVVFQPDQFEPMRNTAYINAIVSDSTKEAVAAALNGEDYSQGALFFCSLASAKTPDSYHEKKRQFLFEHGGHRFYL